MKRTASLVLAVVLVAAMLLLTGCSKQTAVEFTVDGINVTSVQPASMKNLANAYAQVGSNGVEPTKFGFAFKTDGDYAFTLYDESKKAYPITLKVHGGKVEAVTPDGVTLKLTVK